MLGCYAEVLVRMLMLMLMLGGLVVVKGSCWARTRVRD